MLAFALALLLPGNGSDEFNPLNDRDRSLGDSALTQRDERWNPYPQPSLRLLGDRALRFTTSPALRWGERNVVTITPGAKGEAVASLDTVRRQCDAVDLTRCHLVAERSLNFAFCLKEDCSYDGVAARVHALLFDRSRMPDGALEICTDGPGYLTELRESGETYNLNGFCALRHPNNEVYALIRQGVGARWKGFGGREDDILRLG